MRYDQNNIQQIRAQDVQELVRAINLQLLMIQKNFDNIQQALNQDNNKTDGFLLGGQ